MSTIQAIIRSSFWVGMGAAEILIAGFSGTSSGADVMLSGSQEVPPVTTSASGQGPITVGEDQTVSGSVTTTGVVGIAAHIHQAAKGQNGPVIKPYSPGQRF